MLPAAIMKRTSNSNREPAGISSRAQKKDISRMRKIIVVGGGELARVIIEAETASGGHILGFVDPSACEETVSRLGVKRLGRDDAIDEFPDVKLVLGVGSTRTSPTRRRIVESLAQHPDRWASVVHPTACVSPTAKVHEGAVILAGTIVSTGASIGRHAILNFGVMVDHDVHVGAFVHVAPRAALGGGSRVNDDAYIGMGACIRDHTVVNVQTLVGMGAVVAKEYPGGTTLVGIPAKPLMGI